MRVDDGGAAVPRRVWGKEARERALDIAIRDAFVHGTTGVPGRKPDWVWEARSGRVKPHHRYVRRLCYLQDIGRTEEAVIQLDVIRQYLEARAAEQQDAAA